MSYVKIDLSEKTFEMLIRLLAVLSEKYRVELESPGFYKYLNKTKLAKDEADMLIQYLQGYKGKKHLKNGFYG